MDLERMKNWFCQPNEPTASLPSFLPRSALHRSEWLPDRLRRSMQWLSVDPSSFRAAGDNVPAECTQR